MTPHLLPHKIWIILFVSVMTSCALHPPVSEEIVFSAPIRHKKVLRLAEFSSGFSKSFHLPVYVSRAKEKYGSEFYNALNPAWETGLSAYGFAIHVGDNLSVGISPGAIIFGSGLDFTLKLSETDYFTLSGNLYRNMEAIYQRRLYFIDGYGFSLGGFYRHENQRFGNTSPIDWKKVIPSDLLGVRGLFFLNTPQIRLRGFISLGLEMQYKTPVLNIGFSYRLPFFNSPVPYFD